MNYTESTQATDVRERKSFFSTMVIFMWPTMLIMTMIFIDWLYYYDDLAGIPSMLMINFIAVIFIGFFIYFLIKRKRKKAFSFFIPVVLASLLGTFVLIPILIPPSKNLIIPFRRVFAHSRHYVAFLNYDTKHNIRKYVLENKLNYKEWRLGTYGNTICSIVYDKQDQVIKREAARDDICWDYVFNLGDHFYMIESSCRSFNL